VKRIIKIVLPIVLVLIFVWLAYDKAQSWWRSPSTFVTEISPSGADGKVAMLLPDFTQLVEREGSAVVSIQAIKNSPSASQERDPFLDYFRRIMPNAPIEPETPEELNDNMSFGSGFIISEDGYILTNTHVVSGSTMVKVVLNDKREFSAKLIGSDVTSDVSLLKIEAQNLPVVNIGDPKTLKVGEWVAAIGAPFGFDNTVTAGIVSAKGRSLPNENYTPFIQTDVAINPGNSGGPLFNLKGQVVGINSQIYSQSGGFMGISFAIPIDVAMNVSQQLKTYGKVRRGQLGVVIQEVSFELAKSFGLDKPSGALVVKIVPKGPAEKAGIQVGDIIAKVNEQWVDRSSDLPMLIGAIDPGKEVKISIWRSGKEVNVSVTLSELSSGTVAVPLLGGKELDQDAAVQFQLAEVGLILMPLSADELEKRALGGGLKVLRAEGLAKAAGLRAGDIIVSVGQKPVKDEASMKSALADVPVLAPLFVLRGTDTLFLPLQVK
jgi:serine protease Do